MSQRQALSSLQHDLETLTATNTLKNNIFSAMPATCQQNWKEGFERLLSGFLKFQVVWAEQKTKGHGSTQTPRVIPGQYTPALRYWSVALHYSYLHHVSTWCNNNKWMNLSIGLPLLTEIHKLFRFCFIYIKFLTFRIGYLVLVLLFLISLL
jgi:hypothetical protein